VLDINGIEIREELLRDSASQAELEELRRILLKRAFIIAHQIDTHWKKAARKTPSALAFHKNEWCIYRWKNPLTVWPRSYIRPRTAGPGKHLMHWIGWRNRGSAYPTDMSKR
jgi:hypothetical protein